MILEAYDIITKKLDEITPELIDLSLSIHANPELSFKEYFACDSLSKILRKYDFDVTNNIAGLETAFIGEMKGKADGPTLAILAEYDALPMGHGCGHNIIATISMGTAIALAELMSDICGRILVIGTPAEEGGGGKVIMCEHGIFKDVDFAMQIHPGKRNLVMRGGLAVKSVKIEYFGKPAHGTRPEEGINSLNAVIQTFNLMDTLRPLMPLKTSINGMIIEGGKANNVIPEYASCEFSIRGDTVKDLLIVESALDKTVETVNYLFGTTAKMTRGIMYAERYPNKVMADTFKNHLEAQGEVVNYPEPNMKYGSSDIGNVSLEVPTIQPYLRISDADTHTHEFVEATKSEYAQEQMIKGAKALAMTAYDILSSKEMQNEIKEYFDATVLSYTRKELNYIE